MICTQVQDPKWSQDILDADPHTVKCYQSWNKQNWVKIKITFLFMAVMFLHYFNSVWEAQASHCQLVIKVKKTQQVYFWTWNIMYKAEHNLLWRALCALCFMYQEMLFLKITWSLNMDLGNKTFTQNYFEAVLQP